MIRFRLYFDKDKETAWLNEMAAQGWAVKSFFAGFFQFEACEKGEYVYQIDFGSCFFSASEDYREFMREQGIEIVLIWGYWIILRKKASAGNFDLYTDASSSLEHYRKIRRMFKVVTITELICLFIELYAGFVAGSRVGVAGALLIGALFVGCVNILVRLNGRIRQLQEELDGISSVKTCRTLSPLIVSGLLLNSVAVLMEDAVVHPVKRVIQIAAIILMLCGLAMTCRDKKC